MRIRLFLLISAIGLFLDQITKLSIQKNLIPYHTKPLIGDILRVTLVYNPRGIFGLPFGSAYAHFILQLIGIAIVIFFALRTKAFFYLFSYALILGGAAGNLLDRIRLGKVIDFIDIGPINKFQIGFKLPKGWKRSVKKKQEGQILVTAFHQILSSSGLCLFSTLFGSYPFIDLIEKLTGWNISLDELIKTGLRIQNLRQSFTLREGINIADNKLPGRIIGHPPDKTGPTKGISIEYENFYKGAEKKTLKEHFLSIILLFISHPVSIITNNINNTVKRLLGLFQVH